MMMWVVHEKQTNLYVYKDAVVVVEVCLLLSWQYLGQEPDVEKTTTGNRNESSLGEHEKTDASMAMPQKINTEYKYSVHEKCQSDKVSRIGLHSFKF